LAILWRKIVPLSKGRVNDYQVRSAGKSLRLYRNGVFHTQYHPERIVTGDVWELLLVASLGIKANSKVLILGAGGGAVVNLLKHFVAPKKIDVIDMDNVHLQLCERFFLTDKHGVNLINADAYEWLHKKWSHKKSFDNKNVVKPSLLESYDLIIEDLFGEENGQPLKAFPLTAAWLNLLSHCLAPKGRLVVNFDSSDNLLASPVLQTPSGLKSQGFQSCLKFSSPRYQNAIALFSRQLINSNQIRKIINADPLLKRQGHNYFMRSIPLTSFR